MGSWLTTNWNEKLSCSRNQNVHQSPVTSHQSLKCNRDAQLRGRSVPVFPVRLRRWRARSELRGVFVAAQKFVSFNLGYHADAARLVDFGALDAAEASNLHGPGERDFMR